MLRAHSAAVIACRAWLPRLRLGFGVDFGQSEIQYLRVAALGDENVRGLDVAVDDAFGVRRIERIGNLDGQIEQQLRSLSAVRAMRCFNVMPSRNSMAMNRLPFLLADFVDGANVGMVQSRRRLRLALKTFQRLRVFGHFIGQKFQCDKSVSLMSSAL